MPAAGGFAVGDRVLCRSKSRACIGGCDDLVGKIGTVDVYRKPTMCSDCSSPCVLIRSGTTNNCWPESCLELLPPAETKRQPKVGDVVDVSSAHLLSVDGQRIINTVDKRRQLKLKARDTRGGQHWLGVKGPEYLFKEEDIIRYHN